MSRCRGTINIRVLYYRKDLFEATGVEPPKTWEDFAAAAAEVTTGDQQYGYVLAGAENSGMHDIRTFTLNNGGGLFTPERGVNLMDERNVEALQLLLRLGRSRRGSPGERWLHWR